MAQVRIRAEYPMGPWKSAPMPGQYVLIKFNNTIGIISHLISEAPNRLSRPGGNIYKVIVVEPLSNGRHLDYDVEVYSMKPIDHTESESFLEYLRKNHPRIYEARRKYIVNTRHLVADLFHTHNSRLNAGPNAFGPSLVREFLGVQPSYAQISRHYAKKNAEEASSAAKTESKGGRRRTSKRHRKSHRSRKAKSTGRRSRA